MLVVLPEEQIRRWKAALKEGGTREIGGVLMAEQIAPNKFRVCDFSLDDKTGSAAHFVRTPEAHKAALADFFSRTERDFSRFNYLGEWHSHPQFPVSPSGLDVTTMQGMVDTEPTINFAVLLILRLRMFSRLDCSAHVFSRSAQPQRARLIKGELLRHI